MLTRIVMMEMLMMLVMVVLIQDGRDSAAAAVGDS